MSFTAAHIHPCPLPPLLSSSFHVSPSHPSRCIVRMSGNRNCDSGLRRNAFRQHHEQVILAQELTKWHELEEDETERGAFKVTNTNKIKENVERIKKLLNSMEDGDTTVSAYDTAWVAMIKDVNGSGAPQFPSSVEWIVNNQLPDGSWGDAGFYLAHDRLLNTLACVVALKFWNIHPEKCEKGISFLSQHMSTLENEKDEHALIGFEIVFPAIIDRARSVGFEVPADPAMLQKFLAKRDLKLGRIPKDVMYKVATTLHHSLEGLGAVEWDKILNFKCPNGSFLFSPSCTAYAFAQTKDEGCLKYLTKVVQRFNGGVPTAYPVDMFEHIWSVDRLQRLGIARYFKPQIQECINYINRYWAEKGICWARNTNVEDIDDTAMAFRLLRLHGQHVSADVFQNFKQGDEFFCFARQSNQAVTGMYNTYRASQVLFPGEKVLEEAKQFTYKYLKEKQAANELVDKWIITKDLCGEVEYALDVPWYASLPRVESRFYIEQYGGKDDVWIGKTLYRMPLVNNNTYLEVAKQDYNNCQALHRREWDTIEKWYKDSELEDFGVSRKSVLLAYFLAACNIFELERSKERLAWAKTAVLMETISSCSIHEVSSANQGKAFVQEFVNSVNKLKNDGTGTRASDSKMGKELSRILLQTLNHLAVDKQDQDIGHHLSHAWEEWLGKREEEGDKHAGEAELIVQTLILTSGYHHLSPDLFSHPHYQSLLSLTNSICYQLCLYQKHKLHDNGSYKTNTESCIMTTPQIESEMQQLVQQVLDNSLNSIDSEIKNIFLMVAKSFYYVAYLPTETIDLHISKVLFQKVV